MHCAVVHFDILTGTNCKRKLQWYGQVSRSSALTKTILQGTVKGGRRRSRQKKRWKDNIREWIGQVSECSGEQRKMEETGCEIICGAPTSPTVKGWMMMMMMMNGYTEEEDCNFFFLLG